MSGFFTLVAFQVWGTKQRIICSSLPYQHNLSLIHGVSNNLFLIEMQGNAVRSVIVVVLVVVVVVVVVFVLFLFFAVIVHCSLIFSGLRTRLAFISMIDPDYRGKGKRLS